MNETTKVEQITQLTQRTFKCHDITTAKCYEHML